MAWRSTKRGFSQEEGEDYEKTFDLVVSGRTHLSEGAIMAGRFASVIEGEVMAKGVGL